MFVLRLLPGLLALTTTVLADEWASPQVREVFCHSRHYWVRVTPGKSVGDTVGFKGAPQGPYASAELYEQHTDRSYGLVYSITLLNPVAPVDFFVTDEGYLITLDNWHNMGYGPIVCFYSPSGKLIRSYKLQDLFSKPEIDATRTSESSIWWRKPTSYVRQDQRSLDVTVNDWGSAFIFNVEKGDFQFCETRPGDKYICRDSNDLRQWRPFLEPGQ
jgi:hypothetical protein